MSHEQKNAEIIEKILTGVRWATALRIAAQILSWASTIIVVRFISSSDYGLNSMLETPLEFLFLLSTFGLENALVRAKTLGPGELRSTFGWLLVINISLFLLYFFGSSLIAAYFNEPRLIEFAKVLAFIFLLVPFRVIPNALLDRELKFKLKAFAELLTSIVTTITTLTMAILGAGIWALIIGVLLNRVLLTIILMVIEPWIVIPSFSIQKVRGLIAFGGTMALASGVAITGNMIPVLIAGPRIGSELLGIFVISLQFAMLPLAKIMPIINPIIFPAFSKFQGQSTAVAHYMEKSIGIAALALLPPIIGLACIAEEFVPTVLGENWSPAIFPLILLCLSTPFRGLTSFIRQVLAGFGHPGLTLKSTLVTWIFFFTLILAGVNYKVLGLVAAVMLTEVISAIVTIHLCKRAIDTSFWSIALNVYPAIVCSAAMATAVIGVKFILLDEPATVKLAAEIAIGAVAYIAALRLFFANQLSNAIQLLRR